MITRQEVVDYARNLANIGVGVDAYCDVSCYSFFERI